MRVSHINIIIPPVWSGVYYNTARLLQYGLSDLGYTSDIIESKMKNPGGLSLIFGWNLIPDIHTFPGPYIIIQLEPLHYPLWLEKLRNKISFFKTAIDVWDYSKFNLPFLHDRGIKGRQFTLGYHEKMCEINKGHDLHYDILFVGFITERRKAILENLQHYCSVSVQPRWGNEFTAALAASKIILNIHQYDDQTPLEQSRLFYALNNRAFVLSETSPDEPYPNLPQSTYENLADKALHYLYNQDDRIHHAEILFNSFKSIPVTESLKVLLSFQFEHQMS